MKNEEIKEKLTVLLNRHTDIFAVYLLPKDTTISITGSISYEFVIDTHKKLLGFKLYDLEIEFENVLNLNNVHIYDLNEINSTTALACRFSNSICIFKR